ncbi:MAG: cyclic nucleotide-binding domain-containing protein, partial [Chloroflexi bacterium]|nr:cyclic nucleotide-binding domain-containing protein [Chloroflexota bacterium]
QGEMGTDMFIIGEGAVKVVLEDEHGRELLLNEYGPGKVFGELALLSQQPRAATIVATAPTTLHKLTRHSFMQFLETAESVGPESVADFSQSLRQNYKIELLKRLDWFAEIAAAEVAIIADKLHTQRYTRNDILFHHGESGDTFYIIIRGWVTAFVNSDEGDMITLNQFGPGDVFGEMALLDNKPRSASIMALTPLEVLTLKRNEFLAVLEEHAPIALETLRSLTGKLRFAATYLEKSIHWSQRIADGDYSMVLDQIKASQDEVVGATESDEFRVSALLSAFFKLVQGVQQREDALRQEISTLKMRIEIDEEARQEQVQAITQNPFFESLRTQAKKMRHENNDDDGNQE